MKRLCAAGMRYAIAGQREATVGCARRRLCFAGLGNTKRRQRHALESHERGGDGNGKSSNSAQGHRIAERSKANRGDSMALEGNEMQAAMDCMALESGADQGPPLRKPAAEDRRINDDINF